MKRTNLLILTILLAVITTVGCGKEKSAEVDGVTKANAAAKPTEQTNALTPSQTAKNFFEAVRNRQYGDVRELLSKRSMDNLNDAAKTVNTNMDQALKRVIDQDAQDMAANNYTGFETRNEDVRGERATVEVKATAAPEYARLSMVKEDGRWKINIDETSPVGQPK
jgi:hypothetical protein